jgi:hypothetical protein
MEMTKLQQEWLLERITADSLWEALSDSYFFENCLGYLPTEEEFDREVRKVESWIVKNSIPTEISKLHLALINECIEWAEAIWMEYDGNHSDSGRLRSIDNLLEKHEAWEKTISIVTEETSQETKPNKLNVQVIGDWYGDAFKIQRGEK